MQYEMLVKVIVAFLALVLIFGFVGKIFGFSYGILWGILGKFAGTEGGKQVLGLTAGAAVGCVGGAAVVGFFSLGIGAVPGCWIGGAIGGMIGSLIGGLF